MPPSIGVSRYSAGRRGVERAPDARRETVARRRGRLDPRPRPEVVGTSSPHLFSSNVWELVEDCKLDALPEDVRPQTSATCTNHRARGGSWDDYPDDLRMAVRKSMPADLRRNDAGFRVVRDFGVIRDPDAAVSTPTSR
jgi:hypothetical protein